MGESKKNIRNYKIFFKNLSNVAQNIKESVKAVLKNDGQNIVLQDLYLTFKNYNRAMDTETFADIFTQTITYILFLSRVALKNTFSLDNSSSFLSNFNPIMKNLIGKSLEISKTEELRIEELVRLLKASNIEAILQEMNQQNPQLDPILHFYELFLKQYDPKQKIKRGVFYTPAPIVSFIVRSVDYLLRQEFNCPEGLINAKFPILDPATGSGTFLSSVIDIIKQTFDKINEDLGKHQLQQKWNDYVSNFLLPRLFGFELMLASYAVAHLKLGLKLIETGYDFQANPRLGIYLSNALEGPSDPGVDWFKEEISAANAIKVDKPISIIIGNPPYVVNSSNDTPYIRDLMQTYKTDVREEKYIKPLSDDYIKFIRLVHHHIEKTGFGIIGMVTNHGFLSGLIHRGMRKQLLQFFDKIYIIDLHGNSNIEERCPDGSEDQNVFDIQQGVAISFFIKLPTKLTQPAVYHLDLWGERDSKYHTLQMHDISTLSWSQLHPKSPNFFFIPYDPHLADEYNSFISLRDLFQLQRIGILTNRDWLTVDFSPEELTQKLQRFFTLLDTPEFLHAFPQLTDTWWDYSKLKALKAQTVINCITKCLFRPFDIRYITYHPLLLNRARKEVMDHINGKQNLVLIASRHYRKETFTSCFISEYIVEQKAGESTRGSYVFPLYSYSNKEIKSNLTPLAQRAFEKLSPKFDELAIMGYIYAILHSNGYRTRYRDYLKLDFPRIPVVQDKRLFAKLAALGQDLIALHLLKGAPPPNVTFIGSGDDIIQKGYPKFKENAVYINKSQLFQRISRKVWSFIIGGYQMCQKWLKDRRGRLLTEEDIQQYRKIIHAVTETLQIMNQIDEIIDQQSGWPIK